MKAKVFIILSLFLILAVPKSHAQNIYAGNPADPAMLEAAFSNPALNAYVKDRLALALASHQVGVAGGLFSIQSGLISYHAPWQLRGFAGAVQFLKMGMYTENDFRLSFGRRVTGPLSLGANIDVFTHAFDHSQFYMFDDRDPVFRNGTDKLNYSFGVGMAVEPFPSLIVGVAVDHLNQPDIAMGPELYRQPLTFSLGLKWHMPRFNVLSGMNSVPVSHYSMPAGRAAANRAMKYTGFGAEVPFGRTALRASSDASAVQVEAETPVYQNLFVNYRYSYPLTDINLASSGSHRFGFVFDFNRLPPLPAWPILPDLPPIHTDVLPLVAPPCALYYVYADADSANVMRLHIKRNVEPGISKRSLALMYPEDLTSYQAARHPSPLRELNPLKIRDPQVRPRGYYSANYRGALEGIGQQLRGPSGVKQEVISFPGTEKRANALVNAITGDHLAVQRNVPIFTTSAPPEMSPDSVEKHVEATEDIQRLVTPERTIFHIVPMFQRTPINRWAMEVRNSREAPIYTFTGSGNPPDTLVWNWQNSRGEVVPPGSYNYVLKVVDNDGRVTYSDRGRFEVIHQFRSVSIDVTRKSRVGEIPADKYILIVGSARSPFESQNSDTTRSVP